MASSGVIAVPLANGIAFQPAANVATGSGGPHLRGWSMRSTDGVALAVINIRKGTLVTGAIIATIASGHETIWLGEDGVRADGGLYVEVVSGTIAAGALYYS
jgi:hypothetical protein